MLRSLKTFALLLAAAAQQTTTVKPSQVNPPPPASATFHSDTLHLDFTYDSALKTANDVVNDALQQAKNESTGVARKAADCVSVPLTALDDTHGVSMVMIFRWNGTCLASLKASSTLDGLALGSLRGSLQRFGDPVTGSGSAYTLGTHPASAVFGTVKSDKYGLTFYAAATCATQGADTVCWEIMTNDCTKLPSMMAYTVGFDAKPADPLIPAKLTPPCQ